MGPIGLRRYRAERLLREEFEGLRAEVLGGVRGRLRARGVRLDGGDLEDCYAQAWQALYTAVLGGGVIANPAGWLSQVTFRRAIDEHRARRAHRCEVLLNGESPTRGGGPETCGEPSEPRDLAAELDDRIRLRHLFEGLRGRLSAREREAATLCYLQGLSRAQAATRMGLSEARMRKLMEGLGGDRPGVAGKVGALVETLRDGRFCEEQGSLMRGFAFGLLDPDGERYRLALIHSDECPACRAYVASLRGLAAALPPVFLPHGLAAGVLAGGARLGVPAAGTGSAFAGATAAGTTASGPAVVGAKLAVGCLLAVGVGAGCVALEHGSARPRTPAGVGHLDAGVPPAHRPLGPGLSPLSSRHRTNPAARAPAPAASRRLTETDRARREFGPEQALGLQASPPAPGAAGPARVAIAASTHAGSSRPGAGEPPPSGAPSAATREFSPG